MESLLAEKQPVFHLDADFHLCLAKATHKRIYYHVARTICNMYFEIARISHEKIFKTLRAQEVLFAEHVGIYQASNNATKPPPETGCTGIWLRPKNGSGRLTDRTEKETDREKNNTKEILARVDSGNPEPLFRPETLQEMEKSFETWRTRERLAGKFGGRPPHGAGFTDAPEAFVHASGHPGVRLPGRTGIFGAGTLHPGSPRQHVPGAVLSPGDNWPGSDLREDTNKRVRFLLDHGATGLSVLFDLPTIQMYDSDDPFSEGQVGMSGVAVDSVEDMDLVFKDIDLGEVTVSLVTHYPSNSAILFPMYLALAERRNIRGTG